MATRTPTTLLDWTSLSATATDNQYTVPANRVVVVSKLTFYNGNTTTVRQVTINLVDQAGPTTTVFFKKNIPPLGTWSCPDIVGHVLEYDATNPHKINFAQDTGTDVNVFLSGTVITL